MAFCLVFITTVVPLRLHCAMQTHTKYTETACKFHCPCYTPPPAASAARCMTCLQQQQDDECTLCKPLIAEGAGDEAGRAAAKRVPY